MEGPDNCVLVDAEDLAQIDGWWQSFAGTDFAFGNGASNLGSHLFMEGQFGFTVDVDKLHDTSYVSTMSLITPRTNAKKVGEGESSVDLQGPELLIKEARRLRRRRWSMVGVVLVVAVAATVFTVSQVSRSTPASLRSLLLKTSDLPGGWNIKPAKTPAPYPCTSPDTVSSLMGPSGVGVTFERSGGSPILFEYLTRSASTINAFGNAYKPIMTFGSCADTANGRQVDSSTNDGVFYARSYGDWSILSKVTNVVKGIESQLGYFLVRKGHYMMIVGYENKGSLDKSSIENFTKRALVKLNA